MNDLIELLEVTRRVAAQTRQRVAGTTPAAATRRVSLYDPDARPIATGQLGKPVQFGLRGAGHRQRGRPSCSITTWSRATRPTRRSSVDRIIKRTGRKPRTATADRGYGEKKVDDALHDLGVQHVVIPRKGKPGQTWPRTTGPRSANSEVANRQRGPDQQPQMRIRLGSHPPGRHRRSPDLDEHGVFSHNLVKIGSLVN